METRGIVQTCDRDSLGTVDRCPYDRVRCWIWQCSDSAYLLSCWIQACFSGMTQLTLVPTAAVLPTEPLCVW
jgi:hypothetical protein